MADARAIAASQADEIDRIDLWTSRPK